jgi:hypothetical protein
MTTTDPVTAIAALARKSKILHYGWRDRGEAPAGYIKGMAVMFGRCYCKLKAKDKAALDMASPAVDHHTDALAWYADRFEALGLDNSVAGPDTLRHLFVLLAGLGMRESSGTYCEGRDKGADNKTAETAEAGLFQVSYNSIDASPILSKLYEAYQGSDGFIDIFREDVSPCDAEQLKNWGDDGEEGKDFQGFTKACPAFAVEYAAVALRHIRTHWGPIDHKAAELKPDCDHLFEAVQKFIDAENITRI